MQLVSEPGECLVERSLKEFRFISRRLAFRRKRSCYLSEEVFVIIVEPPTGLHTHVTHVKFDLCIDQCPSGHSCRQVIGMKLKWLLRISFVAAVTVLSWFSVSAAVIAIAATILVALQDRASTLIEVSFGPLRAKLERDVSEAEELVSKLRQFAGLQARAIMQATIRTGRWADTSDWQLRILRELENALRGLGLTDDDLKASRADFIRYTVNDAGSAALGGGIVPSYLGQDALAEYHAISTKGLSKTPDDIEAYLRKWEALTEERQQRIDDMRWMIEHQDVKDSEMFARAHKRVKWPGDSHPD